jgi:ribosomal protein S12 methylthiotransferase
MNASTEPVSVGFISLGCAKNLVDSQTMAGELLARGLVLAPSPEAADVVIVNTCAFIETAREESLAAIRSACERKRQGGCRAVLVAGCLPQRYREGIQAALPAVDGFIGLDALDRVADVARQLARGAHGVMAVSPRAHRLFEPPFPVVFTGGPFAYLKIAEGCNRRCAFCAIPAIRGRHRSRAIAAIVREAEQLLGEGFRELNLVSQDVMSYGRDRADGATLLDLLRALTRLGDGTNYWIRLLYGYPTGITHAFLDALAALPHLAPYLDVPIQHSHPAILRAMRRGHTADAVAGLAERVRWRAPGMALRTTCLVGFPGETEAHFEHLLAYVTAARFDHLGAFVYSPEVGTPAYALPALPPVDVAQARHARLMTAQQEIVAARAATLVGATDTCLLEARTADPDLWRARAGRQAPEVDGVTYLLGVPPRARPGDFVPVRYTEVADYDMVAEYAGQARRDGRARA